jgi:hypothetical protein
LATGNTSEFSACQPATGSGTPPLELLSAVSRKQHGAAGTFDINLPLSGATGVESRSSGGNHKLVFTFTNNVTSGTASIRKGIATVAGTSFSGHTMIVNLSNVADEQVVTVALTGVTDEFSQVLPETLVSAAMLMGDTNGNGTVNASDIAQTKAQSGLPVTASNFRTDVNVSGTVNATDLAMVKSNLGAAP